MQIVEQANGIPTRVLGQTGVQASILSLGVHTIGTIERYKMGPE